MDYWCLLVGTLGKKFSCMRKGELVVLGVYMFLF